MAKLTAFQLDVGGLIWVNPDHVTSVQRQSDGIVLIRFAAGQPQQIAQVRGEASDVVQKLCDMDPDLMFDRRAKSRSAEAPSAVPPFAGSTASLHTTTA